MDINNYRNVLDFLYKNTDKSTYMKTTKLMSIAIEIKNAMDFASFNKESFAEYMDVDVDTIEYWLSGTYDFINDIETLNNINNKLFLNIDNNI